jgi:uncharacterized membrane protein
VNSIGHTNAPSMRANTSMATFKAALDGASVTEGQIAGRDYLVAPVVAIVEGVLQGQNSQVPELAMASVFGANIEGWNGRPVVMNHPQVNGEFVSANSPDVADTWAFGQIFAAQVEDSKLKVEAWVDVERAAELGGDFADTLDRLASGEMVEVSVGVFVALTEQKGTFQGKQYGAIWSFVVPDHLALLSEGTIGACSNADGCGAPRVNTGTSMTNTNPSSLACNCSGGTRCTCSIAVPPPPSAITTPTPVVAQEHEHDAELEVVEQTLGRFARSMKLTVEALPSNLMQADVARAVAKAIRKKTTGTPGGYAYYVGHTSDYAIYEMYTDGVGYQYYKVGISVDESMNVTFTSDPVPVEVVMSVIETQSGDPSMTVAQGTTPATEPTPTATATPAVAVTPTVEAARPVTVADYIAAAPAEVRDVLSTSMRLHTEQKGRIAKAILATNRSPFTEVDLLAKSLEELQAFAKLAGVDAQPQQSFTDYSGLGTPRANAADDSNAIPTAPLVFARKGAAA